MAGEVIAGIDMEILGRHDVRVVAGDGEELTDRAGDRLAANDFQRATLAEVVLHVDDEERTHALPYDAVLVAVAVRRCAVSSRWSNVGRGGRVSS